MFLVIAYCKNVWKLKKWISTFVLLLGLYATPLMGNWSTPPVLVYPSSLPDYANAPYLATDENGNSVAVWFDLSGSGSMQAATLASNAVNEEGQPSWVPTGPIASSNVESSGQSYNQAVGMAANGNAIAVWTDSFSVYASTLALGGLNWSSPVIVNTDPIADQSVGIPTIAVAANGNAVVTWTSLYNNHGTYEYTVFAAVFDAQTQSWLAPVILLGDPVYAIGASTVNPIAVDPYGNAIVGLNGITDNLLAFTYNVQSNVWTSISFLTSDEAILSSVAMDVHGNATILWVKQSAENELIAATLPFNQTTLINQTILSMSVDDSFVVPLVVADAKGNAVAVWADLSGALASARYVFEANSWTILPLLDLGGGTLYGNSLSGDMSGNVIAAWIIGTGEDTYVQSGTLSFNSSSWTQLFQLSSSSGLAYSPQIILTADGTGVAIWENIEGRSEDEDVGTINSSIFLDVFSPPSPSYFIGKVVKNQFAMQTDRVHKLNWDASLTAVQYNLYRNSILITTFPAGNLFFSYEDHNRNKKVPDTYRLVAINDLGNESPSLFVTLK